MKKKISHNFQNDGIQIFKNIFPRKLIKLSNQELLRIRNLSLKKKKNFIVLDKNNHIKYIRDLDYYFPFFKNFIGSKILNLAKIILKEDCYVVNVGLHSKTGKDSSYTPAHQDNFYWSRKPASALTAYLALTKQDKKNGVISYALGSHRNGILPHKASAIKGFSSFIEDKNLKNLNFYSPKLKPGDMIFHHCNIIHKANPNRLDNIKDSRSSIAIVIYGVSAKECIKLKKKYLNNLHRAK
jgi:ectoine hydroxylase-related dioxygenase (phytanoyl-CoA dioxygenase family)